MTFYGIFPGKKGVILCTFQSCLLSPYTEIKIWPTKQENGDKALFCQFFFNLCGALYITKLERITFKQFFVNSETLGILIWRKQRANYNKFEIAT